MWWKKIPASI